MSAMDDVFGKHNDRPDHPDFWRISEILLTNDGAIEAAVDKEREWLDRAGAVVDVESVAYMATQRANRLFGPPAPASAALHTAVAALVIDAFVAGVMFEQRGGHQAGNAE